jgi:hypothetical protein
MNDWFTEALELFTSGKREKTLDMVYDIVDNMLLSARFNEVDEFLSDVDVSRVPTVILVGILTITLPACDSLPTRASFFEAVRLECERRGETDPGLLKGLDRWRL